ncbi:MAG: SdiA-regulated domain-containing protein [Odoribacteraceae bacterium]|jgi:uncharacterized protein YjiK|nr:SdiA-regulated domain-containing protein [Odoribacteraceae bacterium]
MNVRYLSVTLFFALPLAGCVEDEVYVPDIREKGYLEYEIAGLPELSGLCYNRDRSAFLAVSDHGGIYEVGFNGALLRQFPYPEGNDFEGITMNRLTGEVYVVDETRMTVFKLAAAGDAATEVVKITVEGAQSNRGLEGIAHGRDTLYIVNQGSPTRLFKYCLTSETLTWLDIAGATYLSDICYDETDDTLWIVDSKQCEITHRDRQGQAIGEPWSIPYVAQAEGLVVDREKGFFWVGCDTTSKLYKILIE